MDIVIQSVNIINSGACWFVKSIVGFLVLILLLRPIYSRFTQSLINHKYNVLRIVIVSVVRPVRSMLPERFKKKPYDMAPLVSSILLIILGFGLCSLIEIFSSGVISFVEIYS